MLFWGLFYYRFRMYAIRIRMGALFALHLVEVRDCEKCSLEIKNGCANNRNWLGMDWKRTCARLNSSEWLTVVHIGYIA